MKVKQKLIEMKLEELDIYKENLLTKLSLLLFVNSKNLNELKESQNLIFKCENLTKEEIIELIEKEEYNYGFNTLMERR